MKAAVDRNRRPGSFLLTGSANLLTMPGAQENLAGRAETIPLYGFSRGELNGTDDSLGDALLSGDESRVANRHSTLNRNDYLALVEAGSYPEALSRPAGRRRSAWFDNYANRILSRDARQVSALARLDRLPMLLRVLAANTSGELVKARVAADVGLPETTLPPYLDLLESLYLIHLLPSWGRNLRRRVVGRPKAALLDSGLACRLGGLPAEAMTIGSPDAVRAGALLETFVASELRKQSHWAADRFGIFHYRERTGVEVDLVLVSLASMMGPPGCQVYGTTWMCW
ncbi:MAG: DUF4143 domain-containing protein [Candidatus Nanopelagicales bacterium]|nr:DUF4143 domain-containing protein [Candidatus Nanopelagicales bacterium]